jgi:hypothetical protein
MIVNLSFNYLIIKYYYTYCSKYFYNLQFRFHNLDLYFYYLLSKTNFNFFLQHGFFP